MCYVWWRGEKDTVLGARNIRERDHLEDLGVEGE
jgi:hypothetical protein